MGNIYSQCRAPNYLFWLDFKQDHNDGGGSRGFQEMLDKEEGGSGSLVQKKILAKKYREEGKDKREEEWQVKLKEEKESVWIQPIYIIRKASQKGPNHPLKFFN